MLVGFVDFQQVVLTADGAQSSRHLFTFQRGAGRIIEFATPPLSEGIHRLSLVVFDNDQTLGLFGAYEISADLYVGLSPTSASLPVAIDGPSRSEPAVEQGHYGVPISRSSEALQLAGNIQWTDSTKLYAALYGSVRDGKTTVAVVVLQNFVQLSELPIYYVALPGRVTNILIAPKQPTGTESLRAMVFTYPDRLIAPNGIADNTHFSLGLPSQKVYLRR